MSVVRPVGRSGARGAARAGPMARARAGALACALAAGLLAACDRTPPSQPGVTRTDSAGVRLITSGARDTALGWRFEEVDVLRDSTGAPYLFTALTRFQLLADRAGRTYVLTRDPAILRFGRDGRQERSLGRRGGGPGEMQFPIALGSKGDTLWVMDVGKRALVRFHPDLSPAPDQRLDGALARADMLAFRTGGVWFRRIDYADSAMTIGVFADTAGPPLRVVTAPLGRPVDLGCVGLSSSMPLFAPQAMMHAAGARLLVNAQPGYELWLYEGPRPIASIRRPLPPRAPTEADVRLQYPQGMSIGLGGGRPPCVVPVERLMAAQGTAPVMPFVFDVTLLPDGTMWALRTPYAAPPVVDVFGSDGAYVGTMTGRGLPLALQPNGELLFARTDEESGGILVSRVRLTR